MIPDICCGVMLEPQNQFFALIDCGPGFDKCVDLIFLLEYYWNFFTKLNGVKTMLNDLMEDFKRFDICWLVNFLKTDKGRVNFGICMKEQRVAFMDPASNVMKPFIVNDVFIGDNGICEDSRFCLNMNCEHNKNTPEQYIKAKGLDIQDFPEGLERLQSNIEDINQIIQDEKIKLQNNGLLYFELPVVTWKKAGK